MPILQDKIMTERPTIPPEEKEKIIHEIEQELEKEGEYEELDAVGRSETTMSKSRRAGRGGKGIGRERRRHAGR